MSAGAGAAQDSARGSSRGGLNAANTLERELDGRRGLLGFWAMAAGRDVADRRNFSFGVSNINSRALRDSARRERSWAPSWCLSSRPSSSSPSQSDARNLVIRSASACALHPSNSSALRKRSRSSCGAHRSLTTIFVGAGAAQDSAPRTARCAGASSKRERDAMASLFAEHAPGQLAIGTLQGENCKGRSSRVLKTLGRGSLLHHTVSQIR